VALILGLAPTAILLVMNFRVGWVGRAAPFAYSALNGDGGEGEVVVVLVMRMMMTMAEMVDRSNETRRLVCGLMCRGRLPEGKPS
jgi:hypothetical protein